MSQTESEYTDEEIENANLLAAFSESSYQRQALRHGIFLKSEYEPEDVSPETCEWVDAAAHKIAYRWPDESVAEVVERLESELDDSRGQHDVRRDALTSLEVQFE